jgi:O-antigen/teichoic acid export membrane protein
MSIKGQISGTFLSQFACFIFLSVYSIIIARSLGPELRGIFFLLQSYLGIITVLASLSLPTIMTVVLSRNEFSLTEVHSAAVIISVLLGLPSIFAGLIIFRTTASLGSVPLASTILYFSSSPLIIYKLMWNGMILGMMNFKILNLFAVFDSIAMLVPAFIIVVLLGHRLAGAMSAFLLSALISFFVQCLIMIKKYRPSFHYSSNCLKSIINLGLKQHFGIAIYNIYLRADAFILSVLSTPQNMGFYSVAKGFTNNISLAVNPITKVMFPHISSAGTEKSKDYTASLFKVILFVGISVSSIFYIIAPMAFRILYGTTYNHSIKHARILAFSLAFLLIQVPMNLWFIGNLKRPLLSAYVSASALILTVLFGVVGLKYIGDYGISWGMLITNLLSSCLAFSIGSMHSFHLGSLLISKKDFSDIRDFIKRRKTA